MSISLIRGEPPQLPLFARPRPKPHGKDLSPEVQPKILRWLTQLLRQHGARPQAAGPAEEGCDE